MADKSAGSYAIARAKQPTTSGSQPRGMASKAEKAKRNRSLTGCGTCRQRHIKCDEARPACRMCQAMGLSCPGYRPQLKWANGKTTLDDATVRRAMFEEPQQRAMVQAMTVSIGRVSVGKVLDRLDAVGAGWPEALPPGELPKESFRGPFGVLYLPAASSPMNPDGQSSSLDDGDAAMSSNSNAVSSPPRNLDGSATTKLEEPHCNLEWAPYLLQQFKSHFSFSYATRQNATICPWQNIHLTVAEEAYKNLLQHGTPAPTGLALLYSLLAASCLHLGPRDTTSAGRWADLGKIYKQEAKLHLEIAIQEDVLSLAQVNYGELLMALLSMTLLEILSAKYNEAEYLLLEAEYIIRTRGLPAPHDSMQLRTLHHVYTYLRILTESTCGCILRNICPAKPGSRYSLVTEESHHKLRSFRVADQSTESDLRMDVEKGIPVALDDIHLELMGDWKESLFPQLYGLPESLLGLLSQTIRLANEQELLQCDSETDASTVRNLYRRTKVLEHNILSWKMFCGDAEGHTLDQSFNEQRARDSDCQVIPSLTETFHQAVILFYYRRVQNINGLMLQDRVQKVLDGLSAANETHEAASLVFPAFLAACEAIDTPLRQGLGDWLNQMEEKAKIPLFSAVAELARQLWALREEKQDYTLSWFDVTSPGRYPVVAL